LKFYHTDVDTKIFKLLNGDFKGLENNMKEEINKINLIQKQFEDNLKLSQMKENEEHEEKLKSMYSFIAETSEEIDNKIKLQVLSSSTSMSPHSIESMIKSKIKSSLKQIMDQNSQEESIFVI